MKKYKIEKMDKKNIYILLLVSFSDVPILRCGACAHVGGGQIDRR